VAGKGHVFVLIGPGGSGKTAIIGAVLRRCPHLEFVPTTTTRPPRPGERSGREYFFVTPEEFGRLQEQGSLLEWQVIHGNLYGMQRETVRRVLAGGRFGITSLDYKGGYAICQAFPSSVTTIFVQPSSLEELRQRLAQRPGATAEDVRARLDRALEEQQHAHDFDYLITNRNGHLEEAVDEVLRIIRQRAESCTTDPLGPQGDGGRRDAAAAGTPANPGS